MHEAQAILRRVAGLLRTSRFTVTVRRRIAEELEALADIQVLISPDSQTQAPGNVVDQAGLVDEATHVLDAARAQTDRVGMTDSVTAQISGGTAQTASRTDALGMTDSVTADLLVATGILDSFNRADSTTSLGSTDTGQAWQVAQSGVVFGVEGNRGRLVTPHGNGDSFVTVPAVAEGAAGVTLAALGEWCGITHRFVDTDNCWKFYANVAAAVYQIELILAGVQNFSFGTILKTPTAGDRLEIVPTGDLLAFRVVNVLGTPFVRQVQSSALIAATRIGLVGGSSTAVRFENFYGPAAGPPTVPGAPTIGTAIAGNEQMTVPWTAPDDDGGSAITHYDLEYEEVL